MTNKLLPVLAVSIALFAPPMQAQDTLNGTGNQDITGRIAHQQGRIQKLQQEGRLSAEDAATASNTDTSISEEQQKMLTAGKGHLSLVDRRKLSNRLRANANFITSHTQGKKAKKQDDPLKF